MTGQYDTGFTQRRHVIADCIHNIGKEADNLEEQLEHGLDPESGTDYGIGLGGERITLHSIRSQFQSANIQRLSSASAVSRQHLIAIRDGKKTPTRNTLKKIVLGLRRLETGDEAKQVEIQELLDWARTERNRIDVRKLAKLLKIDHSTLAQVLNGMRPANPDRHRRLEVAFRASNG